MSKRASIFEEAPALDMTGFAPKTAIDASAPPAEQVREVSQAAQFHSREPKPQKTETLSKRIPRRYRTGRNVQVNVKAQKETIDAFYAITEAQKWVLGYTLERAIEALQRELDSAS